jgi:hypothetical protein
MELLTPKLLILLTILPTGSLSKLLILNDFYRKAKLLILKAFLTDFGHFGQPHPKLLILNDFFVPEVHNQGKSESID